MENITEIEQILSRRRGNLRQLVHSKTGNPQITDITATCRSHRDAENET
jgi:hypothetical protein